MKNYYIIFFITLFTFSCSDNKEAELKKQEATKQEAVDASLKLEKERLLLESEKLKLEAERKATEEQLRRKALVEISKLERNFPPHTSAVVVINKTYFHEKPNKESASKRKFLTQGDFCTIVRTRNGFGYIDYYNGVVNKTTSGWIDLRDLEPSSDEPGGC